MAERVRHGDGEEERACELDRHRAGAASRLPHTSCVRPRTRFSFVTLAAQRTRRLNGGHCGHLARSRGLPDRHAGRQAHLRRSLAREPEVSRERARARTDRPDCAHARARDHLGQTVELAQRFGCSVVALLELRDWLSTQGLPQDDSEAPNKGGTVEKDGIKITLTDAKHSSSVFLNGTFVYLGEPAGLVIEVENGTKLYVAGDTCVFGDMALIAPDLRAGRRRAPHRRALHDGPARSRRRDRAPRRDRVIPCHYGTFPLLPGTPEEVRELLTTDCEILSPEPGGTVQV